MPNVLCYYYIAHLLPLRLCHCLTRRDKHVSTSIFSVPQPPIPLSPFSFTTQSTQPQQSYPPFHLISPTTTPRIVQNISIPPPGDNDLVCKARLSTRIDQKFEAEISLFTIFACMPNVLSSPSPLLTNHPHRSSCLF